MAVFGGTSGIGQATAKLLGSQGLEVAAVGHSDFDIRVDRAVREFLHEHNPRYVVYSAGINELDWAEDITYMSWSRVMNVNVWGFNNVMRFLSVLPPIGAPRSIVAVTSDAAWRPMRTSVAYCAAKAAEEMTMRVWARETAGTWRVNAVAPGKVADTGMTAYVDQRVLQLRGWTPMVAERKELDSSPLGRKIEVGEVAEVISHVLLAESMAFTGAVIPVNGGR